ncbi:MAG: SCP2 sterol-binding domain-containing protein [Micromonosporaceae bacterium]
MDFGDAALDKLGPRELVAALGEVKADDPALGELDIDAVARRIDPRKLSKGEFVGLLATLGRLADAGADVDLSKMDAGNFARIVSKASGDQIEAVAKEPSVRRRVFDELFRRMAEHFVPERARPGRYVMHFRLTGGDGVGGYDHYVATIEDQTCTVSQDVPDDAKTTITVGPADLLKLATGNASPTFLFLRGKVKIAGSLGFAQAFMGLFELPKA